MKEHPILFSGPMIRAILAGRKTQTRRGAVRTSRPDVVVACDFDAEAGLLEIENTYSGLRSWKACPFGRPGDRLWVRETWQHSNHPSGPYEASCGVFYRADYLDDPHGPDGERSPEGRYRTWRPSIHMPRAACRIVLEITAVRVERLQDINSADAVAEGAPGGHNSIHGYPYNATPQEHFQHVWQEINGRGSWDLNPWVWVIEFRRLEA